MRKKVLYFFYNIAQKNTKLLRWMGNGKFSVFTLSYVNMAINQSAFRILKCYIIKNNVNLFLNFRHFSFTSWFFNSHMQRPLIQLSNQTSRLPNKKQNVNYLRFYNKVCLHNKHLFMYLYRQLYDFSYDTIT